MIEGITWSNLWAYSLQVLILVAAGALLPIISRVRQPRAHLRWCQMLLAGALLLPFLQPWSHPEIALSQPASPAETVAAAPVKSEALSTWNLSLPDLLGWILLAGASARTLWLLLGLWRLRQYRAGATPLHPLPPAIAAAGTRVGVDAAVCISDAIKGPVTFGIFDPIVLLPSSFTQKPSETQFAVACHEFLHVRRRDWLWTMCEELASVALWFHPAVWWLTGQIRLAREQVVDREVVALTSAREPYVQALLAMAGAGGRLDLAPAPLFLRRRHLTQRIYSLLKEVSMSRKRLMSTYALFLGLLVTVAFFASTSFPLQGSPQAIQSPDEVRDGLGITVQPGATLLHRSSVSYPQGALESQVDGTVVLELSLNNQGAVTDARVISGPETLRASALQSVLDWHYEPGADSVQVTINYRLPEEQQPPGSSQDVLATANVTVGSVDVSQLPEPLRGRMLQAMNPFVGQLLTMDLARNMSEAARKVDEHARTSTRRITGEQEVVLLVRLPESAPGTPREGSSPRIRVGGNVQAARLKNAPEPTYPPLAQEARIQGSVRFNAVIAKDGTISNLTLVSGHPLLVPAAQAAAKQYVYDQTLLNGQPVEVLTTIDVLFTLPE